MTHHLLAARRGWFLALMGAVALAAALATASVGPDHDASATEPGHTHSQTDGHVTSAHAVSTSAPVAGTAARAAFHDQMRKLWEDHVTWTRLAIVTFADGSGGFDATAARLLANQVDIGDAIKPFYGADAGNQLTTLLNGHIGIAVELLQAAKSGDTAAFDQARRPVVRQLRRDRRLPRRRQPEVLAPGRDAGRHDGTSGPDPRRGGARAERPVRRQRRRLRRDPPPHPGDGRPAQCRHHPHLPQAVPLSLSG